MKPVTKKIIKGTQARRPGDLAERVKADAGARPSVRLLPEVGVVLNKKLLEAHGQADAMVAEARAEARRIRAEAEEILADVERAREEAKAAGFRKGHAAGMASATEYAVRLQEWKAAFFQQAEAEIIRLVVTVAEKVIGKMVQEQTAAIQAIVRQAIESALGDRIVVRLNPEDYRTILAANVEYRDILDRTKRLTFKEDETITKGGCVVETEVGTIDAQLETQLKAIRKALEL